MSDDRGTTRVERESYDLFYSPSTVSYIPPAEQGKSKTETCLSGGAKEPWCKFNYSISQFKSHKINNNLIC